ncbi:TlpA disulfide reductase family protein [Niveibacterium sp. COAC-50]|uniref:TlpA family protein disulfide reductase n=1 Tax=Niveibacterium sp. COAC-50 TaxID=2729384 RepID=UPI0015517B4E|nr:TlpA disulfide reductase family protein [Niveibacterium sp. COAC-50]
MNPTTRRALAAALIIGVSAIAGYAGWRTQRHVDQATPAPKVSDSALRQLMALQLPDSDGRPQALQQWQGKVLVINFWATWCPPCRKEMPLLDAAQRKWADKGVQIVGIGIDEADAIHNYAVTNKLAFPLLVGGAELVDLTVALGNAAQGLPFSVVIGPDGRVAQTKLGAFKDDALEKLLQELATR